MTVATASSHEHRGTRRSRRRSSAYPTWFYLPAAIVFAVMFLLPAASSLFFSLTRWTLFEFQFIGLDNFVQFFREPFLVRGLINTLVYGFITCAAKVILGLLAAVLLTTDIFARGYLRSVIFFPTLVSTVGVGIIFTVLMHPTQGAINEALALFGIKGPGWLTDPRFSLFSVPLVDIWKGVGLATVIFMAGIASISRDYYEAAGIDGATAWQKFWNITLPLVRPATVTVIILSLIGGLRSFDLIWAMTRGGPGFTSDVVASVIYKQYQAGFYGLSTAGNVVLIVVVSAIVVPLSWWLNRKKVDQ